jgi:hypothetical protein
VASPDGQHTRFAGLNTGGLLYGTIVSAAALAVGAGRGDTSAQLIDAVASTLIIYWLAHVYTATVSGRGPGSGVPLRRRIPHAARQEAAILIGGIPALLDVVAMSAAGIRPWLIVLSALGVAIVMLAVDGLLAGMRTGVSGWKLAAETLGAAVFGGLIAVLLVSVHSH